jgi:quinolinate synthase
VKPRLKLVNCLPDECADDYQLLCRDAVTTPRQERIPRDFFKQAAP